MPGGYACIVRAEADGVFSDLASASFAVTEPPVRIDAQLELGRRGRVLVLLDEPDDECSGLRRIRLEAEWRPPIDGNAVAEISLWDPAGSLVDREVGVPMDMGVNAAIGNGADLELTELTPDRLVLTIHALGAAGLPGAEHRVTVTFSESGEAGEPVLDSGPIPTDCGRPLWVGATVGDFTVDDLALQRTEPGEGDDNSDDRDSDDRHDDDQRGDDQGSDDQGSDDQGSDDQGSDDQGSDDQGSDDQGSDDQGSDDQGSDDQGSDDQGSDDQDSEDAADGPPSGYAEPSLYTQRAYLESLLTHAGWSYAVVTRADDFARELRSGGYSSYLLLAERVRLAEQVQKELREAVWRGEGLIEAGGRDERSRGIDEALGIRRRGRESRVGGIALLASPLHPAASASLALRERPLRTELKGAEPVGYYTDAQGKLEDAPAVTQFDYGTGWAVYAGFDLLAEASIAPGLENPYANLLLGALELAQPRPLILHADGVYPVELRLTNRGVATTGLGLLQVPAALEMVDPGRTYADPDQPGQWILEFALDEREVLDSAVWIRLPSGYHTLDGRIQTESGAGLRDQVSTSLTLVPEPYPSLAQALYSARSLGRGYEPIVKDLRRAQRWLRREHYAQALRALIRAADACIERSAPDELRLSIANLTRWTGTRLRPGR
jgi:hypothetical protein